MSINILYLIDSLAYGGTEKQLMTLIRHLDRSRFRPHLCTLKQSEVIFDNLDIPRFSLGFRSFSHPSIFSAVSRLSAFIRQHNIHIVQTFFQDPFLLGAMVKPFNRIKLIGSFRDLGFWRTAAETRKMRLSYPFFSGFIANSQAVKDHFVQRDGIRPEKVEVIYNGIDLEEIQPKSDGELADKPPTVGIVANLNRTVKRVQDFIQAAALVHRERSDVRFVIVGDGQLRKELENLGTSLGLGKVLNFTGRLANPLDAIRSFQVGVITSETEGFCNAILEYMACGVPVVATDRGGNPELIEDRKNGFLYSVGDTDNLAARLLMILDNQALRYGIISNNLVKIKSHYTTDILLQKQYSFYGKVLSNGCI